MKQGSFFCLYMLYFQTNDLHVSAITNNKTSHEEFNQKWMLTNNTIEAHAAAVTQLKKKPKTKKKPHH